MKILIVAFLFIQSLLNVTDGGYSHERPIDLMADLTNDLGVSVLQILADSKPGNVAFSPYGLASISMLLFEGSDSKTAVEIWNVLNLPWNTLYARFGFRDLNRHIKTYFKTDGFLRGLVMSRDNVCFHYSYQKLLRLYGLEEPDTAVTYPCNGFTPYSPPTTISTSSTSSSITTAAIPTANATEGTVSSVPTSDTSTSTSTTTSTVSSTPDQATASNEGKLVTEETHTSQTIIVIDPTGKTDSIVEKSGSLPITTTEDEDSVTGVASTIFEQFANTENTDQSTKISDVINTVAGIIKQAEEDSITTEIIATVSSIEKIPLIENISSTLETPKIIEKNIPNPPLDVPKIEITTLKTSANNFVSLTLPSYENDGVTESAANGKLIPEASEENMNRIKNSIENIPTRTGRQFQNEKFYSKNSQEQKNRNLPLPPPKNPNLAKSIEFNIKNFDEEFNKIWNETKFPDFSSEFDDQNNSTSTEDDFFDDDDGWEFFENFTFSHEWHHGWKYDSNDTGGHKWGFKKQNDTGGHKWKENFFPNFGKKPKSNITTTTTEKPEVEEVDPPQNPDDPSRISLLPPLGGNYLKNISIIKKISKNPKPEKIIEKFHDDDIVGASSDNIFSSILAGTTETIQSIFKNIFPSFGSSSKENKIRFLNETFKNVTTYGDGIEGTFFNNNSLPKISENLIGASKNNSNNLDIGKSRPTKSENCNFSANKTIPDRCLKSNDIQNFKSINYEFKKFFESDNNLIRKKRSFKHKFKGKSQKYYLPFYDTLDKDTVLFTTLSQRQLLVPTFTYSALLQFAYMPDISAQVLELPLDDPRYSFLIILPNHEIGITSIMTALSYYSVKRLYTRLRPTSVYAVIPTLYSVSHVDLKPALYQLGMRDVFHRYRSDLSRMSPDERLYVRNIEQVVTMSITKYDEAVYQVPKVLTEQYFIASHPFVYFILDKETKVSLVAGIMTDPSQQRTTAFV